MPKYTVYFLSAYAKMEGIEANNEDEAIRKAGTPPEFDMNEPHTFLAIEEDEDEADEED